MELAKVKSIDYSTEKWMKTIRLFEDYMWMSLAIFRKPTHFPFMKWAAFHNSEITSPVSSPHIRRQFFKAISF